MTNKRTGAPSNNTRAKTNNKKRSKASSTKSSQPPHDSSSSPLNNNNSSYGDDEIAKDTYSSDNKNDSSSDSNKTTSTSKKLKHITKDTQHSTPTNLELPKETTSSSMHNPENVQYIPRSIPTFDTNNSNEASTSKTPSPKSPDYMAIDRPSDQTLDDLGVPKIANYIHQDLQRYKESHSNAELNEYKGSTSLELFITLSSSLERQGKTTLNLINEIFKEDPNYRNTSGIKYHFDIPYVKIFFEPNSSAKSLHGISKKINEHVFCFYLYEEDTINQITSEILSQRAERSIILLDVPNYVSRNDITKELEKFYGRIESITDRTNYYKKGNKTFFRQWSVIFHESQSLHKQIWTDNVWSINIKNTLCRILPADKNCDRYISRTRHTLRISGLPINTTLWDIHPILQHIEGFTCSFPKKNRNNQLTKTCYVQTTETNYKNFENVYKINTLDTKIFVTQAVNNKYCSICGDYEHEFLNCPKKFNPDTPHVFPSPLRIIRSQDFSKTSKYREQEIKYSNVINKPNVRRNNTTHNTTQHRNNNQDTPIAPIPSRQTHKSTISDNTTIPSKARSQPRMDQDLFNVLNALELRILNLENENKNLHQKLEDNKNASKHVAQSLTLLNQDSTELKEKLLVLQTRCDLITSEIAKINDSFRNNYANNDDPDLEYQAGISSQDSAIYAHRPSAKQLPHDNLTVDGTDIGINVNNDAPVRSSWGLFNYSR